MTPGTGARQASLSLTVSQSLPKFMFKELVMPSNHLIFCHPLLLLPSVFPGIRIFSNKLAFCIRWPAWMRKLTSVCFKGLFKATPNLMPGLQNTSPGLIVPHLPPQSPFWESQVHLGCGNSTLCAQQNTEITQPPCRWRELRCSHGDHRPWNALGQRSQVYHLSSHHTKWEFHV